MGIPTVSIVESGFASLARSIGRMNGVQDPPMAEYRGQIATDSAEEFQRKVEDELIAAIVKGFAAAPTKVVSKAESVKPADVVFRGTLDAVDSFFYGRGWSDGLPFIPPTIGRVEAFLRHTGRLPGEVLGILQPAQREATVWNVAVNGVMAGCLPEYMPILIAIAECIADPSYRIEDSGSTPGWEPLVIINGPIVKQLEFNCGTGAMRPGTRANSSIGRFLNLFMRNVAGLRLGSTDKGTFGSNFLVALAENEDACDEIGWAPYSVDSRGFKAGRSVVTVQSVVTATGPTYSGGEEAIDHLKYLAEFIGESTATLWSTYTGLLYGKWFPLFVISPRIAGVIAKDGYKKADVRRYLYENCFVQAGTLERFANGAGLRGNRPNERRWTLRNEALAGHIPLEYGESDDPDRPVRVFNSPESIGIVLAGDPARNQSRGYMNNHVQGAPVSREIEIPEK
jgi:hypothetical protein